MIPALIIWLCKRHIAAKPKENSFKKALRSTGLALMLLVIFSVSTAFAQTSKFAIKRNGKVIGQMSFSYNRDGDDIYFRMDSKVNTRFIFKIDVETKDYSHFKNGKLLTSSVTRMVNGDPKDPRETKWTGQGYQTNTGSKELSMKQSINYNMMFLYTKEPSNIAEVYSDHFQCFLPIIKKGEHYYRINLPDGNYNDYLFENGVCKQVTVNHSMYTIKMEKV